MSAPLLSPALEAAMAIVLEYRRAAIACDAVAVHAAIERLSHAATTLTADDLQALKLGMAVVGAEVEDVIDARRGARE